MRVRRERESLRYMVKNRERREEMKKGEGRRGGVKERREEKERREGERGRERQRDR